MHLLDSPFEVVTPSGETVKFPGDQYSLSLLHEPISMRSTFLPMYVVRNLRGQNVAVFAFEGFMVHGVEEGES